MNSGPRKISNSDNYSRGPGVAARIAVSLVASPDLAINRTGKPIVTAHVFHWSEHFPAYILRLRSHPSYNTLATGPHVLHDSSIPLLLRAMRYHDSKEPSSRAERKEGSRMEIIYIGVGIFLVWLCPNPTQDQGP